MKSKNAPAEPPDSNQSDAQQISAHSEMKAGPDSRRSFLKRLGLGALLAAIAGQAYAFFRALVPNVAYEDPHRYKIGTVDQFGEGAKFLEDKRVFIFREGNTFHAISAACTHLGCTVKLQRLNQPKKVRLRGKDLEVRDEFHCPCHGSKYYGDGTNYAGPAPRPLPYFKLDLSPEDGQLIVDTSQVVGQDFRLTV